MTIHEAIEALGTEGGDGPLYPEQSNSDWDAIFGSDLLQHLVEVGIDKFPSRGLTETIRCAIAGGIRFGLCVQRRIEEESRASRKVQ